MTTPSLPFRFKRAPEDFIVEEIPLAIEEPDPAGTHIWFTLEKKGISTPEATRRLARALDRKPQDIAFAGRKDAVAVTRQRMSIEHVELEALMALELDGMQLRDPLKCRRRLRVGQLAGNKFHLRLTEVPPDAHGAIAGALDGLARDGVPNGYGEQRFGRGGLTLGRDLAHGRDDAYLAGLAGEIGSESEREAADELMRRIRSGNTSERRRATELARALPDELRAVAKTLAHRRTDDVSMLVRSVPRRTRAFHLAIFQAKVFNDVLAMRSSLGLLHDVLDGDVVVGADGRHRVVDSSEPDRGPAEGDRATGPMWSPDMLMAAGEPGRIEREALAAEGVSPDDLGKSGGLRPRGARRPLVAKLSHVETGAWERGSMWVAFGLPVGSYATIVLDEIRRIVSERDDRAAS